LLKARCSSGWAATLHAPRWLVATPRAVPFNPSRRSLRSRPLRSCPLSQKHFRICLRTHPSRSRRGCRASASRKYPHQPRIYRPQPSRSCSLLRLWLPRHISRTFVLSLSRLSGAIPIRFLRSSRKPRNLRSQTLPVPLLAAFTFRRRCFSIQPCIEASVRSAAV
jgi:hypothetical protein